MLKGINKLTGVRSFVVFENSLLYVNENFELILNESVVANNVLDSGYTFFKEKIIYLTKSNTVIDNEEFENLSFVQNSESYISSTIIFSGDFKLNYPDFFNNYYLYDLNSKMKTCICEFKNLYYFFRQEDIILFSDKTQIQAYSLLSGQPLWQFDLSVLGSYYDTFHREEKPYQVAKFIGIWKNELLVALEEHTILALNIETGKLERSWREIPGFVFDSVLSGVIPRSDIFVLDGDQLIGALHHFLFKIDLPTGEIHVDDLSEELERYSIFHVKPSSGSPVTKTHIFLTAMMHKRENDPKWSFDCLIALNKLTLKIDWHYPFEEESLGINIPQISGDKLYQLDNGNNLHIFERDDA